MSVVYELMRLINVTWSDSWIHELRLQERVICYQAPASASDQLASNNRMA